MKIGRQGLSLAVMCLWFLVMSHAYAALDLELTQGIDSALPVAVLPFSGEKAQDKSFSLASIIRTDLQNSGMFHVVAASAKAKPWQMDQTINYEYWRKKGADHIVVGEVTALPASYYKVNFQLLTSLGNKHVLLAKQFTVSASQLRHLAHYLSDLVYQQLTGERGVFSTRIAYVLVERANKKPARYKLEVADMDGYNPQALLVSSQPIMSPAWSPDGQRIAYVSFENHKPEIYLVNVANGKRTLISSYRGINGAPAWSPDGKQLALVLSKDGAPHVYIYDIGDRELNQLTFGRSIDTEPSWSPDGQSIIFTSDRGGAPQIYSVNLANKRVGRLTFNGRYNARASYTPDGKHMVLLHRDAGLFNIAVQNMKNSRVTSLTRAGKSESPSIAPNGKLIIYATQYGGHRVLGVVSTDNKVKLRLPARKGDVQEPAWSPFMS